MNLIDNITLLKHCLENPEPFIEDAYIKKGILIISGKSEDKTELMKKNLELIESISAYRLAREKTDVFIEQKALEKILEIVENESMNFSEFVSFWPVADISYSIFKKMNGENKLKILKTIVEKYIELRHDLYQAHGYSPATLQVGKDAKAHKENGVLGIKKVEGILNLHGYRIANDENPELFMHEGNKKYIEAEKKGKILFKQLVKTYNLEFLWSKKTENKMPDFLMRFKDDIFIIEHKHIKENGGGQDKQVTEVISFISHREIDKNIHYMSFVDGIYFNQFTEGLVDCKLANQFKNINEYLKQNKQNYFVNTAGFKKLLKSLDGKV